MRTREEIRKDVFREGSQEVMTDKRLSAYLELQLDIRDLLGELVTLLNTMDTKGVRVVKSPESRGYTPVKKGKKK